ncbi:hypothetical protein HJC23_009006 [Cyclotella cryptica]|uniref:Orc1-like AAA ATPase domain-containing protein n=1 Tax=Cyclotella cryptica TaxID=29204 RepID=A0ABD3QXX0_9STRA
MTIPLREWIKGALDPERVGNSSFSAASPQYVASCLRVAVCLSRQISDAEEFSNEGLWLLPIDNADWAGSVAVKLTQVGDIDGYGNAAEIEQLPRVHSTTHDASAGDLKTNSSASLVHFPSDTCEIVAASLHNDCFHNVDSAEISTEGHADVTSRGVSFDPLSSDMKLQRIFSLGLVFYELFSGGKLPPPQLTLALSEYIAARPAEAAKETGTLGSLPNDETNEGPGRSEQLNISATLKIDTDEEDVYEISDRYHAEGARKKLPECQSLLKSSIESLKRLGLPYPLCDLIHNMLDCINGELSGEESYTKMSDITLDLQLMIDEPMKFLHDLDLVHLSSRGLQLTGNLSIRDEEFASLQCAYRRAVSGSSEVAIISGGSGTGKSSLAVRVGEFIIANGGVFLSVKFQQMRGNPFSALMSAFNEYCNVFMAVKDSVWVKLLSSRLHDALGQDVHHLIKVIPKLSDIIDCDTTRFAPQHGCVNELKKIQYLLLRFVEVISSCSKETVTLCLDDIQWADAFSMSVLEQIIMMPQEDKRLFIIGCYRDDEIQDCHPIKTVIGNFNEYGIRLTMIQLDCMDKATVNKMISDILCLSPRIVKSLSDIVYHKTKGNLLFVSQLLMSLNRDGLLNLSLSRRRWMWDEEQIQARKLPDDVATFFSICISHLPSEVQIALEVLSCFGASVACEFIAILESKLKLKLVKPLDWASSEGFVCKLAENYEFSHDRIQEAAYGMIEKDLRCHLHLHYGMRLVEVSLETENDNMLFTAVSQINLAGPSAVTDSVEAAVMAGHNLVAGKKAMALSDFSSAASFFDSGVSFLKEIHWRNHYKLSLELFEYAVKCSLVLGDHLRLTALSLQIFKHAHCLEDRFNTLLLVMSSLAYSSKISQSVKTGLSILAKLGHKLPNQCTRDEIIFHIKQTQKHLSTISDVDLIHRKKMNDDRHTMAMQCLSKLQLTMFQVSPDLQPIATLKMVDLTIEHGMSPMSPVGFAYFASLLGQLGELKDAFRFAKLAKALLDADGSTEILGDVLFTTSEVLTYCEPMQTVNEYRSQGQDVVLATGDVHFACMLRLTYCATMLWTGSTLLAVKDESTNALRYMKRQKHSTSYYTLLPIHRSTSILLGETYNDPLTEDQLTNSQQLVILYYHKMFISFLLNIYDDMRQYAEKFFEVRISSSLLISAYAGHEFFGGLVSFRIYRETGEASWLERGKQCKSTIQLWAEQGSLWNFEHKHFLMKAEEHYCENDLSCAELAYSNALVSARAHKFINDEALAYELAGYFYHSAGKTAESLEHLICAHTKYTEWGACLKVNTIFRFIHDKFGSVHEFKSLWTHTSLESIITPRSDGQSCDDHHESRKRRVV